MRWCVLLAMACSSPHATPLANTQIAATASARTESDAVVTAVLDRFVADPSTMPDASILPKAGPVYVLREIGQDPTTGSIPPAALPTATRPFALVSLADAQAEADRNGEAAHYIRFYSVAVDGDRAVVDAGVDFVLPRNTKALKMCCCSRADRYQKRAGRWTFASHGAMGCI